jgi:hypothetical protein
MQITLKEIVLALKEIATNHSNIHEFGFGDVWELEAKKTKYPLLWVEVLPSSLLERTLNIQFRVYIMTRVDKGELGELDTQNETLLTLNDVFISMKQREYIDYNASVTATPFTERFGDEVSGWFAEMTITIPSIYGECDVPTKV